MISQNFKKIFLLWGPVVLWCGVIFTLSSIPTLPKVGFIWWDFVMKKSAHIIEYGILYFLLWRAVTRANFQFSIFSASWRIQSIFNFKISNNTKKINKIYWLIPLFLGLLYAISDEYHQSFVIGRTSKVRDVGFDLLGMLIMLYWLKKKVKN